MLRRLAVAIVGAHSPASHHRRRFLLPTTLNVFTSATTRPISSHPKPASLKTLELSATYSEADEARILGHLNAADRTPADLYERFDITKGRAQTIRTWRNRNGPLASVGQLLELDGFGVKNVEKLCASILKEQEEEEADAAGVELSEDGEVLKGTSTTTTTKKPSKTPTVPLRHQQFTTPALPESLRSQLRTCCAIHIGITSITWAQVHISPAQPTHHHQPTYIHDADDPSDAIDPTSTADLLLHQPHQLTAWHFSEISDKRLHVGELADAVLDICSQLPDSDVYVLESPRIAQQGPQGSPALVNINVQMAQTVAMVSMAMAARGRQVVQQRRVVTEADVQPSVSVTSTEDAPVDALGIPAPRNVLFLRQLLASRLYQCVVGLERISTASVVAALLEQSGRTRSEALRAGNVLAGEVRIGGEERAVYEQADGYSKEYMGQALLMALAFVRLSVLQDADSVAAVSRFKAKK